MKLIICGNGFDIHHNLPTGYWNYREYLYNQAPNIMDKYESFPWLNEKCKNNLWRDVENSLAINFRKMIDYYRKYYDDADGEIEYQTDYDDWTRFIYSFTGDEFYKWLSSIDFSVAKKEALLEKMFRDAVFITFNYTDTLERVYGIAEERILHLHGQLSKVKTENCFGQDILPSIRTVEDAECYDKPILESDKWNSDVIREEIQFGAPLIEKDQMSSDFSNVQQEFMKQALEALSEKTTKKVYNNLPSLDKFLKMYEIDEIVIMGQSLSGADDLYYSKCLVPLYKDKKWTAFWHKGNNGELDDYNEKVTFFDRYGIQHRHYQEW